MTRHIMAIPTLLAALACAPFVAVEKQNERALDPLSEYATWWSEIGRCSGRSGDMGRIEWWQVTSITVNGKIGRGQWDAPHRITIVDFYVADEVVVKHEMLHDLIGGDPDHSDPAWDACGVKTPLG